VSFPRVPSRTGSASAAPRPAPALYISGRCLMGSAPGVLLPSCQQCPRRCLSAGCQPVPLRPAERASRGGRPSVAAPRLSLGPGLASCSPGSGRDNAGSSAGIPTSLRSFPQIYILRFRGPTELSTLLSRRGDPGVRLDPGMASWTFPRSPETPSARPSGTVAAKHAGSMPRTMPGTASGSVGRTTLCRGQCQDMSRPDPLLIPVIRQAYSSRGLLSTPGDWARGATLLPPELLARDLRADRRARLGDG
jgi:hypothetical protein